MSKRVALIGHCGPDSSFLRLAVQKVGRDVQVVSADESAELEKLIETGVDLLLFNRVLDFGFEEQEGVDVIRRLRAQYPELKMMLVSNYPEPQADAVAAGALPGFGKRDIGSPRVTDLIRDALSHEPSKKTA
jgi:CheY-like chemotaxis protein